MDIVLLFLLKLLLLTLFIIESSYKINNDINHNILDLFTILINNYKILHNNYFTSSNVINNCHFILQKMIPKHFEDKVTQLLSYYQTTFIIITIIYFISVQEVLPIGDPLHRFECSRSPLIPR